MTKVFTFLASIFLLGCEKEIYTQNFTEPKISFTIDSVLNESGTNSLSKDNNGNYHLKLDSTKDSYNRITGKFLVDNKPNKTPSPIEVRVEWKSSYYFVSTSQNTTKIYKSYFNEFLGKWMTVEIGNYIPNGKFIYQGINKESKPDISTGEVNITFKTTYPMKGDTITFLSKAIYTMEIPKDKLFSTIKIDSLQKVVKIICE